MEKLRFTIGRVVFSNAENGYAVLSANVGCGKGTETVVGTFGDIAEGATIVADGEWCRNDRFGRQFSVTSWYEELPSTILGMEKYLGSGLIGGIGKRACAT